MVQEHLKDYSSRWAAVVSISEKIGCVRQTLDERVGKAEVDSVERAGIPTDTMERMKALDERIFNFGKLMRYCARQAHILLRRSSIAH